MIYIKKKKDLVRRIICSLHEGYYLICVHQSFKNGKKSCWPASLHVILVLRYSRRYSLMYFIL
jgi:hypothetical protein